LVAIFDGEVVLRIRMMRLLDAVRVGVADDALLRAIAIEKL
jgi:hypothetical protein